MTLPTFKYHANPIETGSIEKSDTICVCCKKQRGCIYIGPVLADEELHDSLCPWCIAEGAAHKKFDASFTDYDGIGDHGSWENVPDKVRAEIAYKTPGFIGWQQERWWTHCQDGGEFLGKAGKKEIEQYDQSLVKALQKEMGLSGAAWEEYHVLLKRDGSPTAYVFKCHHCGEIGGYSDSH